MKTVLSIFFLLTLSLNLGACGGAPLTDQFLANLSENSGALEVQALHHLRDGSEGEISTEGTKIFTNDLGYEIELEEAFLHFHQIKLITSGSDPLCAGGMDQIFSLDQDHNLLGEDLLTHHLGTVLIPMVFYCEFEIILGSDDPSDAFHLMGTWTHDGDSGEFHLSGEHSVTIHHIVKTKEGEDIIEHPLHFHEGETVIALLIGTKYDMLFDGVDFLGQSENEQLHTVEENLHEALHQHTGDHHGSTGEDSGDHSHP